MSLMSTGRLFPDRGHTGLRGVITGQVGVDKKPFCERVAAIARAHGKELAVAHVGDMMYAEAPDVVPGRILDLPRNRLDALRRSVFKDILRLAEKTENLLVNTHATFRWKHGLFPAFDHDQLLELNADVYFTLVDNLDAIHERLTREHDVPHSLKDILVWREEEIVSTEIISGIMARACLKSFAARAMSGLSLGYMFTEQREPMRQVAKSLCCGKTSSRFRKTSQTAMAFC